MLFRPTSLLRASALALSLGQLGCSSDEDVTGSGVASIYVVPDALPTLSEKTFFDQPWPNDLRLENGAIRIEGYYNPRKILLIKEYIDAMKGQLDGFSPAGAGYLRFTDSIDTNTLPQNPKLSLDPASSVQLIDIDDTSPENGQRKLISLEWRDAEGVYWREHTLAFMPTFGFPLRPRTRYALVVTSKLKGKNGGEIDVAGDLAEILGTKPAGAGAKTTAKTTLAPALAAVEKTGIAAIDIVHLAVFTTSDPTAEMFEISDAIPSVVAAPKADPNSWALQVDNANYGEYTGNYGPSPNFQQGKIPYEKYGDGGNVVFADGKPVVANTFSLRFSLMVPVESLCPMPKAGYPVVLYAHGTGGDYESYAEDGTGEALIDQCIATMGIDEIFHGTRPGAPPDDDEETEEVLFFNFENIVAARTNTRQAAADEIQRARLFTESHLVVPASISKSKKDILFDPAKVMFFGHSQGGLNGPLYLAADKSARGGVLSGSSADISITFLEKTSPPPSIKGLISSVFLGLRADEIDELDSFHPEISLAQSIVDVVDPIHYARFSIREPRAGHAPKSIYQTEGINPDGTGDTYAPPHGIEAHAIALGLPLQLPGQHPILELQWGGPKPVTVPLGGLAHNLANGAASGVLAQWIPQGDDGHFVVFDVPEAQMQATEFLRNLANDPRGEVPWPNP